VSLLPACATVIRGSSPLKLLILNQGISCQPSLRTHIWPTLWCAHEEPSRCLKTLETFCNMQPKLQPDLQQPHDAKRRVSERVQKWLWYLSVVMPELQRRALAEMPAMVESCTSKDCSRCWAVFLCRRNRGPNCVER